MNKITIDPDIKKLWANNLKVLVKILGKRYGKKFTISFSNKFDQGERTQIYFASKEVTLTEQRYHRTVSVEFWHNHSNFEKRSLILIKLNPTKIPDTGKYTSRWIDPKYLLTPQLQKVIIKHICNDDPSGINKIPEAAQME